jgi:ferredoxin-NADP reductase
MLERINVFCSEIRFGCADVNFYAFARKEGGVLPACEPGAHIGLHLPGDIVRQYSLVNSGLHPQSYLIGVKREPAGRGGSDWLHSELRVGMQLWVDVPRNNFPLCETAAYSVLVAGGIGITPIYCMAQRLKALGRPFELHYTCRSRAGAVLLRELEAFDNVKMRFSDESEGRSFPMDQLVAAAPTGSHLYCCGPMSMLSAFEAACEAVGRPRDECHVEYFGQKFDSGAQAGFTVELSRSNLEVSVPAGSSILEALLQAGIYVPHSCSEGVCGACETTVLAGIPDHRDAILSEEERSASVTMMVCCSGSKGEKLVLDL